MIDTRREGLIARIKGNVIHVQFRADMTPCWEWQGGHSGTGRGGGYPRISVDGFTAAVHRVMWICMYGYLPSKKHVDHICRNRLCVNPDHLEALTHKQNCKRRDEAQRELRKKAS